MLLFLIYWQIVTNFCTWHGSNVAKFAKFLCDPLNRFEIRAPQKIPLMGQAPGWQAGQIILHQNIPCYTTTDHVTYPHSFHTPKTRFMGPTWGPSGADRTQAGLMLAPWTLLSGILYHIVLHRMGPDGLFWVWWGDWVNAYIVSLAPMRGFPTPSSPAKMCRHKNRHIPIFDIY